jgi:histidinol-phosphate aminotransferase
MIIERKTRYSSMLGSLPELPCHANAIARLDLNEFLMEHHPDVIQAAVAAVKDGSALQQYYRGDLLHQVQEALADYCGVESANVLIVNGADEAIRLTMQAMQPFNLVINLPTYGNYQRIAEIMNTPVITCEAADLRTFLHDIPKQADMILICSPNNPTSQTIPIRDIIAVAMRQKHKTFVVDNVYQDFEGQIDDSSYASVKDMRNVIYIRSMSKAFGLAGLRIGYIIGHVETISTIARCFNSKSVTGLSLLCAKACMDNLNYYQTKAAEVQDTRLYVVQALQALMSEERIISGPTNFVAVEFFTPGRASVFYQKLCDAGFLVRNLSPSNKIRITIGPPKLMYQAVDAVHNILVQKAITNQPTLPAVKIPVVIINLKERPDRLEQIKQQLQQIPQWWSHRVHYYQPPKDPRGGEIGCWFSHRQAMSMILQTGAPHGLILEDDAMFTSDLEAALGLSGQFVEEYENSWDILRLGSLVYSYQEVSKIPGIWKAKSNHCHAMLVSRRCCERLLKDPKFTPFAAGSRMGVDDYIRFQDLDDFVLEQAVCYQRPSQSDNVWFDWDPLGLQDFIQGRLFHHIQVLSNTVAWNLRRLPAILHHPLNPIPMLVSTAVAASKIVQLIKF